MKANGYTIRLDEAGGAWEVKILQPDGRVAFRRACAEEGEARTFASTIRQHMGWLSEARFRQYYRLPEQADAKTGE